MSTDNRHFVIVLPDLRCGGGQRVLLSLAREFAHLGHRVEVVSLTDDGELGAEVPPNVTHRSIQRSAHGGLALAIVALPFLITYLRRARPDVVLSTMTGTNLLAAVAHILAGRRGRLILREAVTLDNSRSRAKRWLMRRCYRAADALLAVSSGVADDLANLIADAPPIHVIHNPIDCERVRRLASQAEPHPTLSREPYIVSVARLTAQKGHRTLIAAYAISRLRRTHRLVLVGDGEERPALIKLARELGVEDRVDFTGTLVNPYPVLSGAALHVLSSRWEGHPNAILEALALGVPVVATDCSAGVREALQDGRLGRLAKVDDHVALAQAMDAELDTARGTRELPLENSPEKVARKYLEVLFDAPSEGTA